MRPWIIATAAIALTGCNVVGPIAYYLRPPDIQKAELKLPAGSRVALLVDPAQPAYENPVFNQALFDELVRYFRKYKSSAEIIPLREAMKLRRTAPGFDGWSVQRIGRELGADFVIYLHVSDFGVRARSDDPVITPHVAMQMKVIASEHPPTDARVWPADSDGRLIECARPVREAGDYEGVDAEIGRLAADAAYYVMMPFFDVNLEEQRRTAE